MNGETMTDPATGARRHWLYRPESIPKLWTWGGALLAFTVAVEVFTDLHPHFGFAAWFAFNAVYGFGACMAMVLFAKWLGKFVKRPDDYYQPVHESDSSGDGATGADPAHGARDAGGEGAP